MLVREGLSVVDTYSTTNWQYIVVDGENTNLKKDYIDAIVISGATIQKNDTVSFIQYHIIDVLEIN
jgi:hypothetical protein